MSDPEPFKHAVEQVSQTGLDFRSRSTFALDWLVGAVLLLENIQPIGRKPPDACW